MGQELAGHLDRAIGGAAIDQDRLMHRLRDTREDISQIMGFIQRRDNNTDTQITGW
jgi:hypothetical protein